MASSFDPELLLSQTAWLRRFAVTLVTDRDAAEDLSQDAVLAALQHPPDSGATLRGWLRHVVRRRAGELFRSHSARSHRERQVARPEAVDEGAAEVLEKMELQRAVVDALLDLEAIYRDTLALRFFDDLGYEAIAERTGVSVETVRTRLRRGLARIREQMDRRFGERAGWAAPLLGLPRPRLPDSTHPLSPWLAIPIALLIVAFGVLAFGTNRAATDVPIEVVVLRWPFRCNLSDPAILVAKQVANEFPGRVNVRQEDFATSPAASTFGIDAYPAVIVDGELVASPRDFFAWGGAAGRFQPWRDPASRERYAAALRERVRSHLAGAERRRVASSPARTIIAPPMPVSEFERPGDPVAVLLDWIDETTRELASGSAEQRPYPIARLRSLRERVADGAWRGALFVLLDELPELADAPRGEGQTWPVPSRSPIDLAEFEAQWDATRNSFLAAHAAAEARYAAVRHQLTTFVRASVESRLHCARSSFEAAGPFARVADTASALHYIDHASRLLHAADLCMSLGGGGHHGGADPVAVAFEMRTLEAEVVDRFATVPAESALEAALIDAHAACKLAAEMLARDRVAGAQLVLTEARFGVRRCEVDAAMSAEDLRRNLLAARRTVANGHDDFWLAQVEIAELLAERGAARDWLRAQAICDVIRGSVVGS